MPFSPVTLSCRDRLRHAIAVLLLLTLSVPVLAHEIQAPRPTPEEIARIEPPLPGSEEFARALLLHFPNRPETETRLLLQQIQTHLTLKEHIRLKAVPDAGPRDADYHHWRMERTLFALLERMPDRITLDYRPGQPPPAPEIGVRLDQQYNLLLVKVVTGDGGTGFCVKTMDFTSERDLSHYTVPTAPSGVTYALLRLEQVPTGRFLSYLRFQPEESEQPQKEGAKPPPFIQTFLFDSPPHGQLTLEVRDEKGKPTPVLLRLTAKASQRLWEPPNAVDFSAMMNQITSLFIYGPGRSYTVFIPGPFQGPYWIVPGPFSMALPAGEWEIHVLKGVEYERLRHVTRVESGLTTRLVLRLKRPVDMPSRGWYSGDDHVHSRLMSDADAQKLIAYARATDIHICNVLEMGDSMRTWYLQRGFGPEFRAREEQHWLIPGQEDPRSALGHAIGLNLREKVRDLDRYYLNDWIAAEIHRQGGLYGHTHVGSGVKELATERQMALYTPFGIVDFNSIMQAYLGTDLFYQFLNMGFRMTATAGSDTPYGGTVGDVRTYAYVGQGKRFTPDAWFEAVRRGRTFVTNGPMLDFRVENALPGDAIVVEKSRPLLVRVRAWGIPGQTAPVRLQLIRFGRVIQEVEASAASPGALEIQTTVEAERGGWLAARATGIDGTAAHTTPIYIVRNGFRFWDVTQAGALIDRQLQVLNEIEQAIAESERIVRERKNPLDYWNRRLAEQAAPLRERVAKARSIYRDLAQQLERERSAP